MHIQDTPFTESKAACIDRRHHSGHEAKRAQGREKALLGWAKTRTHGQLPPNAFFWCFFFFFFGGGGALLFWWIQMDMKRNTVILRIEQAGKLKALTAATCQLAG